MQSRSNLQHGKTKVFLITGFLGSGKTTLLKRILSWQTDLSGTIVLVNEYGKVGIDGAVLKDAGSDVIELTSGCICCTIRSELEDTLQGIWKRFRPKRILLEATGVARPNAVVEIVEEDSLKNEMEIEKVVTVLDIRFWLNRENFGQFFMKQVEEANLILLNKIDAASKDQVDQSLSQLQHAVPGCRTIPTAYCKIDPETLWSSNYHEVTDHGIGILDFYQPGTEHAHSHQHDPVDECAGEADEDSGYISFDFASDQPMDESALNRFLDSLPWQVFRIKGPVRFPDRTVLLNFVAGQWSWDPWTGKPETRLVLIGWEIETEKIKPDLQKCVGTD
ncbi:MAG: GTP-binding protein [Deltaproteobacteria bacterium]|nr:GTP-binding protein [Deltaproteobacteria bacterium]